jgi:hypothetical protein
MQASGFVIGAPAVPAAAAAVSAAAPAGPAAAPAGPAAAPAGPSVVDQLTKLADLRDRGALTEAEFEAQKAKLLASS